MTIKDFITKTVPFRFAGTDLKFNLSQGLFSSFEVDKGTQLLLKTIAQKWTVPQGPARVADMGCGTGILGICLTKKWPQLEVEAVDRDALATALTAYNAGVNGVEITLRTELGLEAPQGPFDLILSNLPAKAGTPVLEHFLTQMSRQQKENALIAVVIVTPLAAWLSEKVTDLGGRILHTEDGPGHRVLHFTLPILEVSTDLDPYLRTQAKIKRPGYHFTLDTVYGLANFDNLDFMLELGLNLLKKTELPPGNILFWNPGQGHLGTALGKKLANRRVTLAGRDNLALRISSRNLSTQAPMDIQIKETPFWGALGDETYGLLVIIWEKTPLVKEEEEFWQTLNRITLPGAKVIVLSGSHEIQDLIKTKRGWPIIDSPKHRGYRGILLEKT